MKLDVSLYLEDIVDSIKLVEEYTKDLSRVQFEENIAIQDAVMRRLEIIGEAVKNIPNEFREEHYHLPWKQIAGMRDVLIHEYFEADIDRVWNTIRNDLPEFKRLLPLILEKVSQRIFLIKTLCAS